MTTCCSNGFDEQRGTFTQYYGSTELDACLLMLPLVHFLPATDPRMLGTIKAIKEDLMGDGLVLRYRSDKANDGLPPGEGTFLACSFWLVDNLALAGDDRRGDADVQRLLELRNDVGLLSEEWDHRLGRLVGNFPQALTHVGLVNSAYNIDRALGVARAQRSGALSLTVAAVPAWRARRDSSCWRTRGHSSSMTLK